MYRDNEVNEVGEVLARREAGDKAGLVAAAGRLWLHPAGNDGEPDDSAAKVWRAVELAGAVPEAVEAGLALLRAGRLIRPHAFIDLVEHIEDATLLVEIAGLVLDAGWPAQPYLAAVFLWLIESKQEAALWAFIKQQRERLDAGTETWTLVGLVLTTSKIGKRNDVDDWFKGWERRSDVPMWIVLAYAASVAQLIDDLAGEATKRKRYQRLIEISQAAWGAARRDESVGFAVTWLLTDHLRNRRDDEFVSALRADGAALATRTPAELLAHPLVRYVNSAKHRSPISKDEFDFSLGTFRADIPIAMMAQAAATKKDRPVNWRTVALLQELESWIARGARLLPLFLAMHELSRGDPRTIELYRQMSRSYPSKMPWIKEAWKRFVKSRVRWLTRLKLAFV